jgi:predicted O-methyltransferase YrrM
MAAALEELGDGKITSIDREIARSEKPNIIELSDKTRLNNFITPIYANSSYIWELRKILKNNIIFPENKTTFDFCFIDGAHNFETDGFAFFLVDMLLNEGGIILFDDIDWSYQKSPTLQNQDFVKQMPDEEKNAEQIRDVLELLVATHPNYKILEIKNRWAWVQKTSSTKTNDINLLYQKQSTLYQLKNIFRNMFR